MGIAIKDVADYANVSLSTVSRILNKKGNFSEETIRKVNDAIATLKYHPSASSQLLSSKRYNIAIVSPTRSTTSNQKSIDINAIIHHIEELGHTPFVTTLSPESVECNARILTMLNNNKIDGVIICNHFSSCNIKDFCIEKNIPYISTKGVLLGEKGSYVDFDEIDGARQTIDYLYTLGHRHYTVVSGPKDQLISKTRIYGLISALQAHGLSEEHLTILYEDFSIEGGMSAADSIASNGKLPTVIIALSDRIAFGIIAKFRDLSILVPQDVSITSFDNSEMCSLTSPALTSVSRAKEQINETIVSSLLKLLTTPNIEHIQILFKTQLIIRDSCGKVL